METRTIRITVMLEQLSNTDMVIELATEIAHRLGPKDMFDLYISPVGEQTRDV